MHPTHRRGAWMEDKRNRGRDGGFKTALPVIQDRNACTLACLLGSLVLFLSFPRCEVLIAAKATHASGITANQISYLHGLLRGIADRIGSSLAPAARQHTRTVLYRVRVSYMIQTYSCH